MALSGDSEKPWQRVQIVNLEEVPLKEIIMDTEGWCEIELLSRKIVTVEFFA